MFLSLSGDDYLKSKSGKKRLFYYYFCALQYFFLKHTHTHTHTHTHKSASRGNPSGLLITPRGRSCLENEVRKRECTDTFIRNHIQSTHFYQIPTMCETKIPFQSKSFWGANTDTQRLDSFWICFLTADVTPDWFSPYLYTASGPKSWLFHLTIPANTTSDLIDSSPGETSRAQWQANEISVVITATYIFFLKNGWVLDNHIKPPFLKQPW